MAKKNWRNNFIKFIINSWKYLKISYAVQLKNYFRNSSLHGVKYIAATDRPFIERFMWSVCVTVGTVATSVVIFNLWKKFQTDPTITGLDTDFHNWKVSFPAIILCPDEPLNSNQIRMLINSSSSDSDGELINSYYDLARLSLNTITEIAEKEFNKIPNHSGLGKDLRQLALRLSFNCEDVFKSCIFKDQIIDCCNDKTSFFPVLTENKGICYAFNSRHFQKKNKDVKFNMQYIKETDIKWSLEFSVKTHAISSLYQLYIISSDEMISMNIQPQLTWDFKIEKISFSFKETYTTEDTKQLSIKQRGCIFENEIELLIDTQYTYTACTIQCRMKNMRAICGCVLYFYPETEEFHYCNWTSESLICISLNLKKIKDISNCECELGCKNTLYEIETINAKDTKNNEVTDSKIEIGFLSWPMVRYKREVLFGWVDLLVSFGGIAGLFLGFSLLSGIEILYYFTIRAWIAASKERKYLQRIQTQELSKPRKPYDLSLTPYFIAKPLPGFGVDLFNQKKKGPILVKPNKIAVDFIAAPFGIEYVN